MCTDRENILIYYEMDASINGARVLKYFWHQEQIF